MNARLRRKVSHTAPDVVPRNTRMRDGHGSVQGKEKEIGERRGDRGRRRDATDQLEQRSLDLIPRRTGQRR